MGLRICSLLPSATEIVAELGLADCLVGVSEECDWPPQVRGLPVVTASRIDSATRSAREIDEGVREALRTGDSLYALDEAQIGELDPDLIITQEVIGSIPIGSMFGLQGICPQAAQMARCNRRHLGTGSGHQTRTPHCGNLAGTPMAV